MHTLVENEMINWNWRLWKNYDSCSLIYFIAWLSFISAMLFLQSFIFGLKLRFQAINWSLRF